MKRENQFKPFSWLQKKARKEANHFNVKINDEIRSSFNINLYLKYLECQNQIYSKTI